MGKYFGTDGVRGKVGEFPITPDFAFRLGFAFGKVLARKFDNPSVIIGKDTRLSGYLFEASLESGFAYAGVEVHMIGPIPTPAIAYLTKTLKMSAGVVISASHNPYYDNGIKFFSSGGTKLSDALEADIETELDNPIVMAEHLGKVKRAIDAKGRYIEFCKSSLPRELDLSGLTIVLDCANGATYQVAPSVFYELGATVINIHNNPDGVNINRECGSTHPESLINKVIEAKADLGIAFDGDGDRVMVVDATGRLYDGDKLIYIIAQAYLRLGRPLHGIVGTVMTNMGMELALTSQKIPFVRAKVGDRYVMEELEKHHWILGGEASGHILCLDKHTTGDGIIAALQVLSALQLLNKSLPEIIDWEDFPQVLINVKLVNKQDDWQSRSKDAIEQAIQELAKDGRVIVRASGTEPLVRVMVEAKELELANKYAKHIAAIIQG